MKLCLTIVFVTLGLFITPIFASNYGFLNDSAATYFQDRDEEMMSANAFYALNHVSDGKKVSWKNPSTHAWGYAIPSNTVRQHGSLCRYLKIFNNARGVTGVSTYFLCKVGKQWKIVD